MKKSFLFFVFVVCLSSVFGDTGYNGHRWHQRFSNFNVGTSIHYLDEKYLDGWALPIVQEKEILGQKGYVHYGFGIPNADLVFAGYFIPNGKVRVLENKFKDKNKVLDIKLIPEVEEEILDGLSDTEDFTDPVGLEWYLMLRYFGDTAVTCEKEGIEMLNNLKGDSNCRLVIYDYNDDTRVYIFENAINGRSAVVYVPHEQNY